ncbi:hypothetical protein [Anaeromyxobacter terrae]|uniref:hypothetical protein n=1 Tax=Anaeromyxobacter terrae TaxID=2925406 RepID=UPI001F58857B|nr:hypothetical protein [Anaeromyxobacter sp. SG22]
MTAARKTRQPFAHAADLPDAYRELAGVLRDLEQRRHPFPDPKNVPMLSAGSLLDRADEMIADAKRLRSAARRVQIAQWGRHAGRARA